MFLYCSNYRKAGHRRGPRLRTQVESGRRLNMIATPLKSSAEIAAIGIGGTNLHALDLVLTLLAMNVSASKPLD
jgi:hypothetical protein